MQAPNETGKDAAAFESTHASRAARAAARERQVMNQASLAKSRPFHNSLINWYGAALPCRLDSAVHCRSAQPSA